VPRVYVALGSNLEPERHLVEAARALRTRFADIRFSSCYRNAAQTPPETPRATADDIHATADYVNAVATFQTDLQPQALRAVLREIEANCGRRRDATACVLDLDLLWYDGVVGMTPAGPLPRPELVQRSYQLGPMAELAPQQRHPEARSTLAALWSALEPSQPPLRRLPLDLNQQQPAT
jgi:2-amino-4-hydroxy-6-hydroxymethyldihydropteridine diphosphokinase